MILPLASHFELGVKLGTGSHTLHKTNHLDTRSKVVCSENIKIILSEFWKVTLGNF